MTIDEFKISKLQLADFNNKKKLKLIKDIKISVKSNDLNDFHSISELKLKVDTLLEIFNKNQDLSKLIIELNKIE